MKKKKVVLKFRELCKWGFKVWCLGVNEDEVCELQHFCPKPECNDDNCDLGHLCPKGKRCRKKHGNCCYYHICVDEECKGGADCKKIH